MATIIVESLTSVLVDGKPSGTVVDVLATNKEDLRAPLLDALLAWETGRFSQEEATIQTRIDAATAPLNEQLAAKDKELTDTVAKYAAVIAALQDPNTTKEDAAAELAKEARARELEALQAQLDSLNQQEAEVQAKIDALKP